MSIQLVELSYPALPVHHYHKSPKNGAFIVYLNHGSPHRACVCEDFIFQHALGWVN
ncbi:hypothetical protein L208DRAFT_1401978 [Tricholoma matsutake]|nr:hypothetical protein L208DRAFT_1401978 [Tricholoma matsutake 945]